MDQAAGDDRAFRGCIEDASGDHDDAGKGDGGGGGGGEGRAFEDEGGAVKRSGNTVGW